MKALLVGIFTFIVAGGLVVTDVSPHGGFKLQSAAFKNGDDIPTRYTCKGLNTSPPLHWEGAPTKTKSFALIVDDPDAPDPKAPKVTWVHWIVYNIPVSSDGFREGAVGLPDGTKMAQNSWHKATYGGPCPPIGKHRYFFKLYALDENLKLPAHADKAAVEKAMAGHILGHTQLIGLYEQTH